MPTRYEYTYQIVVSGLPLPGPTEVAHAPSVQRIELALRKAIDQARLHDTGGAPSLAMPGGGIARLWLRPVTDITGVPPDRQLTIGPRGGRVVVRLNSRRAGC